MKRMFIIGIMAASVAVIIGCGADQKTELKFTNGYTQSLTDIKWTDSTATVDVSWSGETLNVGSTNAKKEVKVETGKSEATLAGGAPVQLEYIDSSGANQQTKTLAKDEENTWIISNAAKK